MNVGSVFSGIGGLDEGLRRAGHRHVFFCEIDAYRRDVLRARFPGAPVYDDVRDVGGRSEPGRKPLPAQGSESSTGCGWDGLRPIDLLCGGFPCQDLSVAGRRAGLAGNRSGLFFEFARIAESLRPSWLLVENVPGLLSSNGGRDFGVLLGTLADIGYGLAWRIVDSRFFGVPQRRRRVFIVGAFADGDPRAAAERAGEVLAVGQGCARHLASRGEARPGVAGTLGGGAGERGWAQDVERMTFLPTRAEGVDSSVLGGQDTREADGSRVAPSAVVSDTVRSHPRPGSNSDGLLVAGPLDTRHTPQGHGMAGVNDQAVANNHVVAAPLTKGSATGEGVNAPGRRQEDDVNLVVAPPLVSRSSRGHAQGNSPGHNADAVVVQGGAQQDQFVYPDGVSPTLAHSSNTHQGHHQPKAMTQEGVRRLTPTECERLQGFPDGWTQLGDTPDSRRYSALGDAVTVNVSEWIGHRLARSAGKVAA